VTPIAAALWIAPGMWSPIAPIAPSAARSVKRARDRE